MSYHLVDPEDKVECLFCCDESIDLSFNGALVFDQLFQFPSKTPYGHGGSIFLAATYCTSCGSSVNDIQKLLKDLRSLERKLNEWRNRLGTQLKNSFDKVLESESEGENSRAQKIREEILAQFQKNKPTSYTTRSPWLDTESTSATNLNTNTEFITGDVLRPNFHNEQFDPNDNGPPSPTASVGSEQSFEEKFTPPEVEVNFDQNVTPTITTEVFAGDLTETSTELENVDLKRALKRKSYLRRLTTPTCPFEPSCGMHLTRTDEISKEAHRLRYHEGVRNCYVCKNCGAAYSAYNSIINHLELHHSGEASNISEADNASTSMVRDAIGPEMSEDVNKVLGDNHNIESLELDLKNDETEEVDVPRKSKRKRMHPRVSRDGKIKSQLSKRKKSLKDEEKFVCHYCQLKFQNYKQRLFHIRKVHEPEKMIHKCKECNLAFVTKGIFESHMRMTHTGERPFMCEICSETFTAPQYLRFHQVKHNNSGATGFKCELCDKQFASPTYLSSHVKRIHTGEFRFKCDLCEFRVLKKSELQIHVARKHSEERNFVCTVCPGTFKLKSALTTHMKRHSNVRNFKCSTCGKAFVLKTGLYRHELIHSNAQTHVCQVCGKTFPVRNYLYIHMRSHNKPEGKRKSANKVGPTS